MYFVFGHADTAFTTVNSNKDWSDNLAAIFEAEAYYVGHPRPQALFILHVLSKIHSSATKINTGLNRVLRLFKQYSDH